MCVVSWCHRTHAWMVETYAVESATVFEVFVRPSLMIHYSRRVLCRVQLYSAKKALHSSQLAWKLLNFLPQPLHAMTRHLYKFRDFWTSFSFYIIKNTCLTSWWSCFVKQMFEISRMSLHTASKYTKKHEYHFLNR